MIRHLIYRSLYWLALARIRYWTPIISGQRRYAGQPHPTDVVRLTNALIARSYWLRKSEESWK